MTDTQPPELSEVVVYTLHRINEHDAEKREFDAMATPGHIRLIDSQTGEPVLVAGVLLTLLEDFHTGFIDGSLFAITENAHPTPIFRRTRDGRFEMDDNTLVKDVQMTLWSKR
ncbi:hypothetical protein HY949_01235 [Candidatus Gottesmanbacteria bacterium]|nr:hypothetical protein [Candidatus Gottesmanbacteria bacterium]